MTSAADSASSKAMPQSSSGLLGSPIGEQRRRSVRAANAVPIWQATIPTKVTVVACR